MVSPAQLVRAAARIHLNVLCITDHDRIGPLDRAIELGATLGIDVVRGQEITCHFPPGIHVLGLFLSEPVRMGMTMEDTVEAIHDQDGLAVIPHPFMPTWFASAQPGRLERLLDVHPIDGIEVRHTAPMLGRGWRGLDEFVHRHRDRIGSALGAGDSHFGINDLGRVVTLFPGRTAADLKTAIRSGAASPARGVVPSPPGLRQRLAQQGRSMIWLNNERRQGRIGAGIGPRRPDSV